MANISDENRKHSILAPSAAGRWLLCTPSARYEMNYPNTSNEAADEGTLAHRVSELLILSHFEFISKIEFNREMKKCKNNHLFNKELYDHAFEFFSYMVNKYSKYKLLFDTAIIAVEETVDLTKYVPSGFGHIDEMIITDEILDITDLKYGKGVRVDAFENPQGMLYALGALTKYKQLYNIHTVRITIYQPRLDNISTYEISANDLINWGENYVKPKAEQAFSGLGKFVPGDYQCKFCKAKTDCKALMNHHMELAKYSFADVNKLTDEDIATILDKANSLKEWLTSIQNYALNEAVNNNKVWPRHKLVEGKSSRVLSNEEEIIKKLKRQKINQKLYLSEPKLLGITALETNIGKSKLNELIGQFIIKPKGAPTLVPEWDKRKALDSNEAAKEIFSKADLIEKS